MSGFCVQDIAENQTKQRPQQGIGVFLPAGQTARIDVRREGPELGVAQVARSQDQHPCQSIACPLPLPFQEHRPQGKEKYQRNERTHAYVQRRVDPQIHPRYRNQNGRNNAANAKPLLFRDHGHTAEYGYGTLGMAAGEAVIIGSRTGLFHNGEIGVQHPGPGDPAGQLQELSCQGAGQANSHDIIALPLVDAPEKYQRHRQKRRLLPQAGKEHHQCVQKGGADAFEQIKKSHKVASGSLCWTYYSKIWPDCKDSRRRLAFFSNPAYNKEKILGGIVCFPRNHIVLIGKALWRT